MIFKFRDNRPQEEHFYNTKKECDTHFDYVLRNRTEEIKTVYIGPLYGSLEKINLRTTEESMREHGLIK